MTTLVFLTFCALITLTAFISCLVLTIKSIIGRFDSEIIIIQACCLLVTIITLAYNLSSLINEIIKASATAA